MQETSEQTEGAQTRQTPGELLKQARENLGLTPKDIAAQLNLDTEIIRAVENNDKVRIPIGTYFRGYIRSYSRLVKLDGDILVALYDHESTPLPEIIPNIKKPAQPVNRDKPLRAFIYLITFILALLLLAWLIGKYSGESIPATTESGLKMNQPVIPETRERESVATPETPQNNLQQYNQIPEPQTLPETATITPDTAATPTDVTTDHPVIDTTLPAAINPAQAPPSVLPAANGLELFVKNDSWIEVYDANKTRMFHGLAQAGKQLKLTGTPPYSITLGFAPGVTVIFNGEIFNTTPYTSNGLARFTLGAKPGQRQ